MVRKQCRSGALILCLLLLAGAATALEKTIELGKDKLWSDIQTMDGVTAVPGKWGFHDLVLAAGEYAPDSSTEMLLHFDASPVADATRAYTLSGQGPLISSSVTALGPGSAAFTGRRQGVAFTVPPDGMFSPGAAWSDFSIEFWLYPATLSDGETVISWSGFAREGSGTTAAQVAQGLRCYIRDRKLTWDFSSMFALPTGERLPVTLAGTRQLLPRVWHHHLLRFNSREGLLEYRIDGVPEAILHTTDTGSESGSIAVPLIGRAYAGPLVIGAGLAGFLDELRISRRFVEDPALARFTG
ncbi:MAG: LamG-like jellyroll fold domain-containing protein, partial [Spirochaetia bacterium]